jgi:cell division protease FtsH
MKFRLFNIVVILHSLINETQSFFSIKKINSLINNNQPKQYINNYNNNDYARLNRLNGLKLYEKNDNNDNDDNIDNGKLRMLDDELFRLNSKIKKIKKVKGKMFSNIKGLKLISYNETDTDTNTDNNTDTNTDPDIESNSEFEELIKKIFTEDDEDDNQDDDDGRPQKPSNFSDFFPQQFGSQFGPQQYLPQNMMPSGIRVFIKKPSNKKPNSESDPDSTTKSENFEVLKNTSFKFSDVGGYDLIKSELMQCADLLTNYDKYAKYNVRTPKGLILEGPPGNGKTLLAKSFSGEINVGFIPVSGAQFQEKYVGVGASRIRELFQLAKENIPCVIFIDEIDALGRQRSGEGESHNTERDSTLNELLVSLDGFKSTNGIFVMGATNRIDLLDTALTRPGRIDKKIFVGNPDRKTREAIINIHIKGKPYENSINVDHLLELTNGFSGAQIENFLNEAMLYALRNNREMMNLQDMEIIANRILVGWQSTENKLSQKMIYQIAVHEMGHALIGLFTNYKKLVKVTINLWSPKSLGFTLFEPDESDSILMTKEKLINELMVLLGGRVAEEIFFDNTISSGASQDLDIARKLVENMVIKLGMGRKVILPYASEKYKEQIDAEIEDLINTAYQKTKMLLLNAKELIHECSNLLAIEHEITPDVIKKKIRNKYFHLKLD